MTVNRRALSIAALASAALPAPAAAQAATYTVAAGQGACGGADSACESLVEAAGAVAAGDTVQVAAGTYAGTTFAAPDVRIAGPAAGGVIVNSTLTFSGGGATPATVSRLGVVQTSGTAPAINVTGTGGLVVSDSIVASSGGNGITFNEGEANKVQRSTVATGAADAIGVLSAATSPAPKALTVDSTIVAGGVSGVAVRTGGAVPGAAGNVTLDLRHVTAAGSTNSVVLDSSRAGELLAGGGSITSTINDSIITKGVTVTRNPGTLGVIAGNTITDNRNRNLDAGDPAALFANPARGNYKLRTGSPAIDKAGTTTGESATDVDGQPLGADPTDAGADQFVNSAPTAKVAASAPTGRQTRPVNFSAAGSTDPDGPISAYRWTFSDGATQTTSAPSVAHAFKDEGNATASLVVSDPNGASSAPATASVNILDGLAPLISIDKPKANQTIRLVKKVKGRSRRTKIAFAGRALDKSGISKIIVSIRQVSRRTTKKKTKARSSATRCRWLSPNRGMVVRSCRKPVQITAKLSGANWT